MKTLLITLVFSAILLQSCHKKDGGHSNPALIDIVSALVDKTDLLLSLPDTGIEKSFGVRNDISRGARFRVSEISDLQYNRVTQYEIPSQSYWLSNPGQRGQTVAAFFRNVDSAIAAINNEPVGKKHSEIYSVVAREANFLAASKSKGSKVLLVYSNLYENAAFSMYRPKDRELLRNHPEQVAALFEKEVPLQDLSGVFVHLIYQAVDFADAQNFSCIARVYQSLLEAHHANVIIQANL